MESYEEKVGFIVIQLLPSLAGHSINNAYQNYLLPTWNIPHQIIIMLPLWWVITTVTKKNHIFTVYMQPIKNCYICLFFVCLFVVAVFFPFFHFFRIVRKVIIIIIIINIIIYLFTCLFTHLVSKLVQNNIRRASCKITKITDDTIWVELLFIVSTMCLVPCTIGMHS